MAPLRYFRVLLSRQDTSSTSSDTNLTSPPPSSRSSPTVGIIIAAVLGTLLFFLLLWVGFTIYRRVRFRRAEEAVRAADGRDAPTASMGMGADWSSGEKVAGWKANVYVQKGRKEEREREKRRSMHKGWHVSPSSVSAISQSGRESYLDIKGMGLGSRGDTGVGAGYAKSKPSPFNLDSGRFNGVGYGGNGAGEPESYSSGSSAGLSAPLDVGSSFSPLSPLSIGLGKKPSRPSLKIYIPGSGSSPAGMSHNNGSNNNFNQSTTSLAVKEREKEKDQSYSLKPASQSHLELPSSKNLSPQSFLPLGSPSNGTKRVSTSVVRLSHLSFGLGLGFSSSGNGNGNSNSGHIVSAGGSSAFTMSTATTGASGLVNGGLGIRVAPPGLGSGSGGYSSMTNLNTSYGGGVTKYSAVSKKKKQQESKVTALKANAKPKSSWKAFHLGLSSKPKQLQAQLQSQSQISLPVRNKPTHPFLDIDPSTNNAGTNSASNANNRPASPTSATPSAYPSSVLDIRQRPVSGATMTTRVTIGTIGTLGTVGTRASSYGGYGYGPGAYGVSEDGVGMWGGLPPVPPVPVLPPPVPVLRVEGDNEVKDEVSKEPTRPAAAHVGGGVSSQRRVSQQQSSQSSLSRGTSQTQRTTPRPLPQPQPSSQPYQTHTRQPAIATPQHQRKITGPRHLPPLKSRSQGVGSTNAQDKLEENQAKEKGKKAMVGLGVEDVQAVNRRSFTPFSRESDDPPPYRRHLL